MSARALLLSAVLAVAAGAPAFAGLLFALPAPPTLTPEGRSLIYEYEVGGGRAYFERYLQRPTWPGAASGVTIGVGWDAGYNSAAVLRSDWRKLPPAWLDRLARSSGVKGTPAKAFIPGLRDILVEWQIAEGVFNEVTLARFTELTRRTFSGFDALAPNAQAALVSLVFNRGSSLAGPSRSEMRAITALVPRRDYAAIAGQLRQMKRLWAGRGLDGLLRRREAEARLVETCIR